MLVSPPLTPGEIAQDLELHDQEEEEPQLVDDAYSQYESCSPTPYGRQSPDHSTYIPRGANGLAPVFGEDDLVERKWSTFGHEYQVIDEIW